jgi:chromosome segregation ATPase
VANNNKHEEESYIVSSLSETKDDVKRIEETVNRTSESLAKQDTLLAVIKTKLEAIHGNGSGRKCILDRLEDSDIEIRKELTKEIDTQRDFRDEIKQSLFRLTNMLENIQRERERDKESSKANKDWIKWVAGGIGVIVWKLIEVYVLKR